MDEVQQAQLIRAHFGRPAQPDAAVTARSREAALAAVGGSSRRRAARRRAPVQLITAAAARARLTHGFPRPRPTLRWARSRVLTVASAATAVGAAGTAALTAAAVWQLAAAPAAAAAPWSVATEPGGKVTVTIRELRDPAGLQHQLREDGVPRVRVRMISQFPLRLPFSCQSGLTWRSWPQSTNTRTRIAFTINPSAMPAHVSLWIYIWPHSIVGPGGADFRLAYASGRCPSGKAASSSAGFGFVVSGSTGSK